MTIFVPQTKIKRIMSRNQEELSIRMKLRKKPIEELQAIVDGDYTDLEKKIAGEMIAKAAGTAPTPEAAPETETEEQPKPEVKEDSKPKPAPKKKGGKVLLSPEEEERLSEAEEEFNKRQAARKTPSKTDKSMKKTAVKQEKSLRETKRQTIDASDEVEGLTVGSRVKIEGDETEYTVTKLYRSSDGKEKCLISDGKNKPLKKRVTSLKLV